MFQGNASNNWRFTKANIYFLKVQFPTLWRRIYCELKQLFKKYVAFVNALITLSDFLHVIYSVLSDILLHAEPGTVFTNQEFPRM